MKQHYLTELYKNPKLKDPVANAPEVHKHFTRYSKGEFDAPVIKIRLTANKINFSCSYEYEDIALKLALKNITSDLVTVKGSITSGVDFTSLIMKLGFSKEWLPAKSTGKTQNYVSKITTPVDIEKAKLEELFEKGIVHMSFLFDIDDTEVKLKTKIKPPRPSSKSPEKSPVGKKLKFCSLKIGNTPENIAWLIDEAFPDFKDEIPEKFKSILLENSYEITDLEFPPRDKKISSRQFRLNTLRIGKMKRILTVDEEIISKSFEFRT